MAELRQHKKDDIAAALEDIAWKCVTRLTQSDIIERSTRPTELSTVAGIAVDKMLLLRRGSTAITENKLEQRRWAEERLQETMREFKMSREEALELVREKAPTWAGMLM